MSIDNERREVKKMTVQEMQELYNKGEITFDELDEFVKEDANLNGE